MEWTSRPVNVDCLLRNELKYANGTGSGESFCVVSSAVGTHYFVRPWKG